MAGTIVADTLQDGAGNSTAMDNAIYGSAKAWVNFNGQGTPAIRASYNISSITLNSNSGSQGDYTLNFTNAFVDANFALIGSHSANGNLISSFTTNSQVGNANSVANTTTTARFITTTNSGGIPIWINAAVFR